MSDKIIHECKCGLSFHTVADAARHISLFPGECQ